MNRNPFPRPSSSRIVWIRLLWGLGLAGILACPLGLWANSPQASKPLPSSIPAPVSRPLLRHPSTDPLPLQVQNAAGAAETTSPVNRDLSLDHPVILERKLPWVDVMMNRETFHLEVASTMEDQKMGLMFRESLAPRHGMIFPFAPPRAVNFWMKNCKISLDMVFIRKGTVVHVVESAPPCLQEPCPVFGSVYPIDTVVELPAGSVREFRIQLGSRVQLVSTKPYVKASPEPPPSAPSPATPSQNTPSDPVGPSSSEK